MMDDRQYRSIGISIGKGMIDAMAKSTRRIANISRNDFKNGLMRGTMHKNLESLLMSRKNKEMCLSQGVDVRDLTRYTKVLKDAGVDFTIVNRTTEIDILYDKVISAQPISEAEKMLFDRWHTQREDGSYEKHNGVIYYPDRCSNDLDLALEQIIYKELKKENLRNKINKVHEKFRKDKGIAKENTKDLIGEVAKGFDNER